MRSFGAFFMLVTFDVVVGQETQDELDYKEKHFCESDETIKSLQGSADSSVETKRCGIDKHGKASCVNCYKCANAFERDGTVCKNGNETQEELEYKEKHFCEGEETGKFLKGSDGEGVVETKRCGFDKSGKPQCMYCNKCAEGYARDGTNCATASALMGSPKPVVLTIAAFAVVLAVLAGLFFVCKMKRSTRSDSGANGNVGQSSLRSGKAASRRASGARSQRR